MSRSTFHRQRKYSFYSSRGRDYHACGIYLHNPIFSGGISLVGRDSVVLGDHHKANYMFLQWDKNYDIKKMAHPRFKHALGEYVKAFWLTHSFEFILANSLAVLSDGVEEHIVNLFGYSRDGKLTNTVERYVNKVTMGEWDRHWEKKEGVYGGTHGGRAMFASAIIPASWVEDYCPVKPVNAHAARGPAADGAGTVAAAACIGVAWVGQGMYR